MCINRQATVPQTGQTTCYDSDGRVISCAGTGQDGDIRAGVVPPVPHFTDNGQGQITDNLTRLVWLKNMDCEDARSTWQEALDFANTLADGKCGLTDGSVAGDWRLPNRNELRSLLDFQDSNPPLPAGNPFINVRRTGYWTSTTYGISALAAQTAWNVEMGDLSGRSRPRVKESFQEAQVVTAVRNPKSEGEAPAPLAQTGQTTCWDSFGRVKSCAGTGQDGALRLGVVPPDPRFTDNGDGTITDNLTGLVWLRNMDCGVTASWQAALNFANLLADGQCGLKDGSVAGDWRLPNVNELTSLLDLEKGFPALPVPNPFTNVANDPYWTSTTVSQQPGSAWEVFIDDGNVLGISKTARRIVTAVKGLPMIEP
jgi:hypothetical protein